MNKEHTHSIKRTIYASKETVWKFLLSPEFYRNAWVAKLTTNWVEKSTVQFTGFWEGVEYTDKGVVTICKENQQLEFTYWSSFWDAPDLPEEYCKISYILNQLDDYCCKLTIKQTGFRDDKHFADTVEMWDTTIEIAKLEAEKLDLIDITNQTFEKLISYIDSIDERNYNKPVKTGWNTAMFVEHIILGNSEMKQFLLTAPLPLTLPYDMNIENIRKLMTNTIVKLVSPNYLIPEQKMYAIEKHKTTLLQIQVEIIDCILEVDLKQKCGASDMPGFGFMSNFEWLNFSVFHIMRHTNQLVSY